MTVAGTGSGARRQMLLILGHAYWLRDRAGPEHGPQLLIQVDEVFVLEELPRRQRHVVAFVRKFIVDHAALPSGPLST